MSSVDELKVQRAGKLSCIKIWPPTVGGCFATDENEEEKEWLEKYAKRFFQ